MKLSRVRLHCPGSLGDLDFVFCDQQGVARSLTVVYGGSGAGKTTLLRALNSTRPGHVASLALRPGDPPCFARSEWLLGIDEPDRQHSLSLASPNAPAEFAEDPGSDPADALRQRREAAFFERLAREGGFAYLSLSALRWFSKSPLSFHVPERSIARYDVRANEPLEDAARNDLTRDVKQALAYAAISAALPASTEQQGGQSHESFGRAMQRSTTEVSELYGYTYSGLDRASLEPHFTAPSGKVLKFDALPGAVKHAVAIPALVVRLLWAAYPNLNPLRAPAVVAIDQFELHQEESILSSLVDTLLRIFPEVQWLLTTRSTSFLSARDESEIIALRRAQATQPVDVHAGASARVH